MIWGRHSSTHTGLCTYLLSAPADGESLEDRAVIHSVPAAVSTAPRTVPGTKALSRSSSSDSGDGDGRMAL